MNIKKFTEKTKKKLIKIQNELNLEESAEIINELNVLLEQLNAVSQLKKSEKLLPSEIAELIKNTPLIDINGIKRECENISVEGNSISIWYCDAGDWEQDEQSDYEEEQVLTKESLAVINAFLNSLSPQIHKIEIEYYHLADVKLNLYVSL